LLASRGYRGLCCAGDIGVYAAGLRRRDTENSILYASIDSIHKKGGELEPYDVIIIDECHRIAPGGNGKYRTFIDMAKKSNPKLRVVGFTATPYRMGCGPICHEDHILNEVCYEANIGDLINDGYLCRLRSKIGSVQPDLSEVKRNSGGDYIVKSLAEAVDKECVVSQAINEAVKIIAAEERNSIIFFCCDVEHCKKVSQELRRYGIDAPYVTGKTSRKERDSIADRFKRGKLKAICNVNVYTEGFNAKQVDAVVLLRPTLSKGLYVQMVGRGLRLHENKEDCLILDFAHCIDEHGPIDCIDAGKVAITTCSGCGDAFSRAVRVCPNCGWEIPKEQIEREEAEEREKRLHEITTSKRSIISGEPEDLPVHGVSIATHIKAGKPNSLRVEYRCGLSVFREWVCLDHEGFARRKAEEWWRKRFNSNAPTVSEAVSNLFLANDLNSKTEAITVVRRGKITDITDFKFRNGVLADA